MDLLKDEVKVFFKNEKDLIESLKLLIFEDKNNEVIKSFKYISYNPELFILKIDKYISDIEKKSAGRKTKRINFKESLSDAELNEIEKKGFEQNNIEIENLNKEIEVLKLQIKELKKDNEFVQETKEKNKKELIKKEEITINKKITNIVSLKEKVKNLENNVEILMEDIENENNNFIITNKNIYIKVKEKITIIENRIYKVENTFFLNMLEHINYKENTYQIGVTLNNNRQIEFNKDLYGNIIKLYIKKYLKG
jgi:hypothetical protein